MDWSFWGYGLLAVGIAVVLSSVELLTKHQSRGLREIFLSVDYFWFALLNVFFCFLVYWTLPGISGTVLNAEFPLDVKTGLGRALAAGLGYLVIARLSILDITTKAGETYGAGVDAVYNAFAQYFLRRHSHRIRTGMRNDFFKIYEEMKGSPGAFTTAAQILYAQLEGAERARFDERLQLTQAVPDTRVEERCLGLYQLIRDHTNSRKDADDLIRRR